MSLKISMRMLSLTLLFAMLLSVLSPLASAVDPADCLHEDLTLAEEKAPTCQEPGFQKWSCNTCGQTVETALDPISHDYQEGFCTMCRKDAPGKQFTRTDFFTSGDRVVLYNSYAGLALSFDESTGKLVPSQVTVEGDVLTISEDTAVFTAHFLQKSDSFVPYCTLQTYTGEYLTSDEERNLYYSPELNASGLWWAPFFPESERVHLIQNGNADLISGPSFPCIQFKDGLFSVGNKHESYEFSGDERFCFLIYSLNGSTECSHSFDEGTVTKKSTCQEEGIMLRTCTRCDQAHTIYLPTVDHEWQHDPNTSICYPTYICKFCGIAQEEMVKTTGHFWMVRNCGDCARCKECGDTSGIFTAIDSVEDLTDGDQIIIAADVNGELVALDSFTSYYGIFYGTHTEASGAHLTQYRDSPVWDLVQTESGFALYNSEGYLYQQDMRDPTYGLFYKDIPYSWQITGEGGRFHITPTTDDLILVYNGTSSADGCYQLHESEDPMSDYDFADLKIYKYDPNGTLPHVDTDKDNTCDYCQAVMDPAGCLHEDAILAEEKASTCQEAGYMKWSCTLCGYVEVETLNTLLPHNYEEGFCTMCGKDAPGKQFTRTNMVSTGDRVVFYNADADIALSFDDSTGNITASKVTVEGDVLTIAEDTAVFTYRFYDGWKEGGTLQIYTGEYLTGSQEDCSAFYSREKTNYSFWNVYGAPDSNNSVFLIENMAVTFQSVSIPCIQFQDDLFSIGGKHGIYEFTDDVRFYFIPYTLNGSTDCDHDFAEGVVTKEPTCIEEGTKVYTCTLCGKSKTHYLSLAEHTWELDSCAESGYAPYTCKFCGFAQEEMVKTTGHKWVLTSCNEPALCENCGITGGTFTEVNTLDDLTDGDQIIIAADVNGELVALDNFLINTMYLSGHPVEKKQNTLTSYRSSMVWTLVQTDSGFALHGTDGYLHQSLQEVEKAIRPTRTILNGFFFDETPYSWQITGEGGRFHITPTTDDLILVYNGTSSADGCYQLRESEDPMSDYNFPDLRIYKYDPNGTLPHVDTDKDNVCDHCIETVVDATLLGRTLSLNGNIAINFMMSLSPEVTADENAYMLFTQEGKEPVRLYHNDRDERNVRGVYNYVYSYELAAMEMTDTITAQYFYGDGKCTEVYTYSVKEYADNMRNKLSDNKPLADLLDAMLRYGAASQRQFNYHTERLADEGLEPVDYSAVTIEGYPKIMPQGTNLVTLAGVTLQLNSETTLRFHLRVDPSVEQFTVTYKGEPMEISSANNLYCVEITDISAPDLDELFTITVNDGTSSADIRYSPLTYCASVKNNIHGGHSESMLNVVTALYLYNMAANTFFTPAE